MIATALVLLPTAAHAAGPDATSTSIDHAGPLAATAVPDDDLVELGLVGLVTSSLVLVLVGRRRPDDDEPAD
ncbi:hypothetical protein CXY01_33670 [Cellulomonas xylanilytica]|uniref:Gram-positive cocci surface proteins LPxTG domain-containing protein n=1 Tax=Cellulomonas xylanilytica TaxID=233583 RepID=A0A510V7J3_9CELL|nr:hypothetical protein CXY01_33670 [Cellulomonas xylanilytica]